MGSIIYALCAVAGLACALLLWRGYRRHGEQLLLFSGFCFTGLAINNMLVFLDFVIVPDIDLALWRNLVAAVSVVTFLLALIWFDGDAE